MEGVPYIVVDYNQKVVGRGGSIVNVTIKSLLDGKVLAETFKGNEQLEGYLNPFCGGTYPAMPLRTYLHPALDPTNCGTFPPPANIKAPNGVTYKPKPKPKPNPKPTETPTPTPTAPTTPPPTEPTEPEPTCGLLCP